MEVLSTPPPSSYRPGDVDEELDHLRQKGLAKLLNKHFTDETKRIAQERAAADRALRDLEQRKADTATFHPSLNDPHGWENLVRSVTEWRNDCRKKEQETLALYQRYVHKFGFTGQVKAPSLDSPPDYEGSPTSTTGMPTPQAVPPPVDLPQTPFSPESKHPEKTVSDFLVDTNVVRNLATEVNIDDIRSYYMDQVEDELEEPSILLKDEGSVVSGLTDGSFLPQDILEDCERTVVTFLNQEREALRQYREELDTQASSLEASVQNHAVAEAENLVNAMQQVLKNYQIQESPKGKPLKTSNPNEQWMVHYDETFKREYYHELNSNKTQWESPEVDVTSQSSVAESHVLTPVLSHDEVMPEVSETRVSRIAMYRKKRRRQRRRRIIAGLVLSAIAAGAAKMYYNHQLQVKETQLAEEQARREETLKLERELKAARAAARRERERAAAERAALEAARLQAEEEEAEEADDDLEALERPWGCNVPFAYLVNGNCRRLAKENPIFNAEDLVNDMLF